MQLGYSITSAHPRQRSPDDIASELVERAHVASDAGFDYVQAGDHHVTADRHYFQNVPTLARLTETIDRVAALALLPLHDPVVVADSTERSRPSPTSSSSGVRLATRKRSSTRSAFPRRSECPVSSSPSN